MQYTKFHPGNPQWTISRLLQSRWRELRGWGGGVGRDGGGAGEEVGKGHRGGIGTGLSGCVSNQSYGK